MPISKSGGGVRVDKSSCIPFGTPAGTIALTTAYQTVQSITGKGFLDTVILAGHANINSLRITVDGVVKFEGTSNNATYFTGFTKRDLLITAPSSSTSAAMAIVDPMAADLPTRINSGTNIFGFPYTANVAQPQTLSISADSIYFNSSLLIEAKAGTANTAGYYIAGGYQ